LKPSAATTVGRGTTATSVDAQRAPIHGRYRPDIDGLRAVAVISVIGFHAFPSVLRGGFIGVDVFFVISGFLISGIIFRDLEVASFSYAGFYARRIRRIFPALVVMLAATLVLGWYVMLADEFTRLGKHVVAGAGFVSNLLLWDEGNYFNGDVLTKPLLHLWSLGVEEQFYLLWPPILVLTWRRSPRLVRWVAVVVTIVSLGTNLAIVRRFPEAAFYSPLSRFWELTAGGVLAHIELGRKQGEDRTLADAKSVLGAALIGFGLLVISELRTFPGAWAVLPTLGTCLVISAGPDALVNRNLLARRAMVAIGLVSYPLYLWHWPLLSFAHIVQGRAPGAAVRLALIAATTILAIATYRFAEKRWRRARGRRPVLALLGCASVSLLAGLVVMRGKAQPRNSGHGLQRVVDAYNDFKYPPTGFDAFVLNGRRYFQHLGGNGKVMLFGDSHLDLYGERIHRVIVEHPADGAFVYLLTTAGCPPIPQLKEDQHPECEASRADALVLGRRPDVDAVVVGACWNCYFMIAPADPTARRGTPESFEYYFEQHDGARAIRKPLRTGEGAEPALLALENVLRTFVLSGKRVFLLLDNPIGRDLDPKTHLNGSRLTTLRCDETNRFHRLTVPERELRRRLTQLAVRAGAIPIDPLPSLCVGDVCPIQDAAGAFIYRDANHLRTSFVANQISFIDATVLRGGGRSNIPWTFDRN